MSRCLGLAALLALLLGAGAARHVFPRRAGGARRAFGGRGAALAEWGAACALLDRYWRARCSGAVLAPRWALTAAHCATPRLAYVKYNARRPAAPAGDVRPVLALYRHPRYRMVREDAGAGEDVTLLHHDVGLVRTRGDMRLSRPPARSPLRTLALHQPADLLGREVTVLGFGRTERAAPGEELVAARLRLVPCERAEWLHCACARAAGEGPGEGEGEGGACAGDSGGPVLFGGALLGVTSLGPAECAGAASSVLTALAPYARVLRATMRAADAARAPAGALADPRALLPPLLLLRLLA